MLLACTLEASGRWEAFFVVAMSERPPRVSSKEAPSRSTYLPSDCVTGLRLGASSRKAGADQTTYGPCAWGLRWSAPHPCPHNAMGLEVVRRPYSDIEGVVLGVVTAIGAAAKCFNRKRIFYWTLPREGRARGRHAGPRCGRRSDRDHRRRLGDRCRQDGGARTRGRCAGR